MPTNEQWDWTRKFTGMFQPDDPAPLTPPDANQPETDDEQGRQVVVQTGHGVVDATPGLDGQPVVPSDPPLTGTLPGPDPNTGGPDPKATQALSQACEAALVSANVLRTQAIGFQAVAHAIGPAFADCLHTVDTAVRLLTAAVTDLSNGPIAATARGDVSQAGTLPDLCAGLSARIIGFEEMGCLATLNAMVPARAARSDDDEARRLWEQLSAINASYGVVINLANAACARLNEVSAAAARVGTSATPDTGSPSARNRVR